MASDHWTADNWAALATIAGAAISIIAIVVGVVISILSTNSTRKREAEVKRTEAAKPFLELRQKLYTEAIRVAVILTNPSMYTPEELERAKSAFASCT
jgi:hypothetical protein